MNKIVSFLTLLFIPTFLFAQKSNTDVDLGIKLGANFSNINGKYWENGYKANLLGGAYLGINGRRVGIQLEAVYTQATFVTGNQFTDIYKDFLQTGKDSIKGGNFRVNYITVPLLLNIRFFSHATIQLGPQFSGVMSVQDKDEMIKDASKLFNNSWDGVIGLWIKLPAHLNFGVRYIIGLSNINKLDGTNSNKQQINDAWQQRALQLHLGYSIL
ncbi:MAG: PorT family protein [Bacteroidetes bacterium]|nr:PorT family protein [Bacteroidota bacterium]MBS1741186.1 PorT family protein [Bacteroidota bacterium]